MPTQPGPYRPRGFAPLFRNPAFDQNLRVSDAERQAVTDRLAGHYAEGRLDQAEFDERSSQALTAKTRADLNGLFDDLPAPVAAPSQPPQVSRPRARRRHPVLVLAFLVLAALAVVHATAWLWLGILLAVLLIATRRSRPTRLRPDR
jgi:hypothetical protein